MIVESAELAAYYSQGHDDSRLDMIVMPQENMRRVRSGKPGMVSAG
jgi:hypothetical protein